MPLRIRDITAKALLPGVQLAAGFAGADNPVSWVTLMEILDMPESLQKGELLITTGYRLDDEAQHSQLMETLKTRDISGIAIQTGCYIDEVPAYILRQAEQYGIPVLLLPEGLTFSAILRTLIGELEKDVTTPKDDGLAQLETQLRDELLTGRRAIEAAGGSAYVLLAIPAGDDMAGTACVQEGAVRIKSYLLSQADTMWQASLPDGREAFCLTLPAGCTISEVIFELTILLTFLSEQQHVNFFVGAQQLAGSDQFDKAWADAGSCCDMLTQAGAKRGVCRVQDQPFFALFRTISRNNRESVLGKHSILHTLLDYDRAHGTSYVHTLRVYLAHGGGQSATATRLFIHRHTLTGRLNKIRQLCGWDLNDYYTRTYLSVALMLHDYFAF